MVRTATSVSIVIMLTLTNPSSKEKRTARNTFVSASSWWLNNSSTYVYESRPLWDEILNALSSTVRQNSFPSNKQQCFSFANQTSIRNSTRSILSWDSLKNLLNCFGLRWSLFEAFILRRPISDLHLRCNYFTESSRL